MITVDRISKSFMLKGGRRSVLRDLSFDVPNGDLAILGGPGAGKSTLLRLIGGLDHPDRGRVLRRGTVSWPFGQARFEKAMTINQNLRFLCRVLGGADFDRISEEAAALTGFSPKQFAAPVDRLRMQQQRTLSFALSLCFDFDILLLDGRPMFRTMERRDAFRDKFQEKCSKSAVIMTTANPDHVENKFAYVLVLDGQSGRLYDNTQEAIEAFEAISGNAPPQEAEEDSDE